MKGVLYLKAYKNGSIYIDSKLYNNKVVVFNDKIVEILDEEIFDDSVIKKYNIDEVIDLGGNYLLPGFIDQHIHGFNGFDVMDSTKETFQEIKNNLVKNGVTSFLPTTVTASVEELQQVCDVTRSFFNKETNQGSKIVGVHLEGPYINIEKKGAQNEKYITLPNLEFLEKNKDVLKIVTLAPEIEGSIDTVKQFKDFINFQVGHTNANYSETMLGFESGIVGSTHTFNAMTPIHHRDLGAVGASLMSDSYVEIIADTIHTTPKAYDFVLKFKDENKVLLITDCISAGGLNDGEYSLGGLKVTLKDGECRLDNGALAGSVLKLNEGLKNFVENSKLTLESCIKMVTTNQSEYLGISDKVGSIKVGLMSDFVELTKELEVVKTFVNGVCEYNANISK